MVHTYLVIIPGGYGVGGGFLALSLGKLAAGLGGFKQHHRAQRLVLQIASRSNWRLILSIIKNTRCSFRIPPSMTVKDANVVGRLHQPETAAAAGLALSSANASASPSGVHWALLSPQMPMRVVVFTSHRQQPPTVSLSPMPTPPRAPLVCIGPCVQALVLTFWSRIVTNWYT